MHRVAGTREGRKAIVGLGLLDAFFFGEGSKMGNNSEVKECLIALEKEISELKAKIDKLLESELSISRCNLTGDGGNIITGRDYNTTELTINIHLLDPIAKVAL